VREALRRLGGESLVYGLGAVGGRAVQLLLVPVLTRALRPDVFGVGELVVAYAQTALLVLVFGMDGALARFFHYEPDREARVRMASTSFAFRVVSGLAAAAALAAFAGPLAGALVGGEAYAKYLRIGAATLPATLVVLYANDVLRVTFQPWKFILLNLVQTALVGGLSILFVVGMGQGVAGMLYGRLGGDAASAVLGLALVRRYVRPHFDRATLARMLHYGAPTVPAAFAFGAIGAMDRFFLQRARSLEEVGVYAVAVKFFAVASMGVSAFAMAYGPFAFARAADPQAPRLFARVFGAYVAAGSLGALALGLFAPEALAVLVPEAYRAAAGPATALAFAAVALGAYTAASVGVGIALRTPLLVWCAAAAAAASLVANAALVPRFGAAGAAAATLAGYVVAAVATYAVAQRVHPLPYRGARMAALFAVALALALAVGRVAPAGAAGAGLKLAAVASFAALCAGSGIWRERGAVAPPSPPA